MQFSISNFKLNGLPQTLGLSFEHDACFDLGFIFACPDNIRKNAPFWSWFKRYNISGGICYLEIEVDVVTRFADAGLSKFLGYQWEVFVTGVDVFSTLNQCIVDLCLSELDKSTDPCNPPDLSFSFVTDLCTPGTGCVASGDVLVGIVS